MRIKNLSLSFLIVFSFFVVFNPNLYAEKMAGGPIITPIVGLETHGEPGSITIKNISGKDIPATKMLLSFTLDQTSIPSFWSDSPWLNWQPANSLFKTSFKAKLAAINYQYINQANLDRNIFPSGATISAKYSLVPWDTRAVPTNIQLFNLSYPLSPANISVVKVDQVGGNITIKMKNNSDKAISLSGAQFRMTYSGQIRSSIWGVPWANWSVSQGSPNYILNSGTSEQIPANAEFTIAFVGDAFPVANIALWVQGGAGPNTNQGEIVLQFPATPQGATVNPTVTLTGPSFPQGLNIIGTWGLPYVQKNLQIGTYTFSAPDVITPIQTYSPTFTPNPVLVSSSTNVNLMYSVKELGKLVLQMSAPPSLGVAAPMITVSGPDFPNPTKFQTSWSNPLTICANATTSCNGINAGFYTLTIPTVYSNTDAFLPMGFTNPVEVKKTGTITVPVSYSIVPQGNFTLAINIPTSLKKGNKQKTFEQNVDISFTNLAGYVFTKNLRVGSNTVSLPVDTYTITAPNVSGRVPNITPSTLKVNQTGTPPVTINYEVGASTKFAVYYGGWSGNLFNLNTRLPVNVTSLILSFANITSSLQVDTSVSGWITNIPAPNVRLQPTYFNWTTFKNNHPNTKVLLAVGGATFSAIWNSVLTPQNADTIAKNIAEVVNRPYPVYKTDISAPSDLIGNVYIDGVDLDVETGGRLSQSVTDNIILLTKSLKKYMNPDKLITFAGFSVGADPNDSRCTVPSSIHCGEDIPLLQSVGDLFNWVSVMAYDAGQEYAKLLYQKALANYAQYVPKSKVLLGLDVQAQWPGFNETPAELATKATWQKQNGYPGVMFWGVGVENNPTKEQQYIDAIAAAIQ